MRTDYESMARIIAEDAHKGQVRKFNALPYIVHPRTVAATVDVDGLLRNTANIIRAIAWLHDVIEDSDYTLDHLRDEGFPEEIIDAVDALTKREDEDYVDYLQRVSDDMYATRVKIADIKHNLSDLKKGTLRDKYKLALMILEKGWL